MSDDRELIRDLLRNTQKTDRNALLIAIVIAFQTVLVALIEIQREPPVVEGCDKIGLLK